MENREGFNSTFGMIMAAVGSAVGLGNIWRFPYIVGMNGGGAFLLVYLAIVVIIGVPLMMSELVIGRRGQSDSVGSFKNLAPGKKWYISGVIGVLASFMILSFYAVVAGWTLEYIYKAATNSFVGQSPDQLAAMFSTFISSPIKPIFWTIVFMLLTITIVRAGVQGGIEKVSSVLIPVLLVLVILLDIRGLTLEGGMAGLRFLFYPDFTKFSLGGFLAALGHAFFSMSLGMGIIVTYGSYVSRKDSLPKSTLNIAFFDTLIALLSGIAIFPAVFAFGLEPGQGAGLVFITLPNVFPSMPGGYLFGIAFFLLLALAALTSTISLLEAVVAYGVESMDLPRKKATWLAGGLITVVAVFCSLSNGPWSGFTIAGKTLFDFLDYITANYLLTIAAFIEIIFLGWAYKKSDIMDELTNQGTLTFGLKNVYYMIIKYLAPIVMIIIFLSSIGILPGE
ncbi:MAG: sodium-dependent transporter [Tissierellia bacterium]|nr:sodium-dependent transporter [Tissierellia bacterium]